MIDRSIRAKETDQTGPDVDSVASWIASYWARYGREDKPNRDMAAQVLTACGDTFTAEYLIRQLIGEQCPPGESPAWLVTVALQRCAGATPEQIRARRALMRAPRQQHKPATRAGLARVSPLDIAAAAGGRL